MDTNNNFDSKKIIEEIENLENDTSSKKKRKFGLVNFIETAILVVLIIYIIMTVGSQFIKDIFAIDDYDYEYDDYYYDEYDEYDEYYDYSTEEDYYPNSNDSSNIISNTLTIEEFLDSNYKNMLNVESVEKTENENLTNTIFIEATTETTIEEESNIYNEKELLIKKFEEQKKYLKVTNEGKNINGDLLISIENGHVVLVNDLDFYTIFYKEDKIVGVDTQTIELILPDNKKYLKIEETPEDYDRFETFISKYTYTEYMHELLNKNISYAVNIEDEVIEVEIKNSGKNIDRVNFTILYFDKDKNILDIEEESEYDIGKYLGGSIRGYGVWDEINREYVDYDSYEIILDYAESYNY